MRTLSGCLLTLVLTLPAWATDTPRFGFHSTDNADQNENWSKLDSKIPLTRTGFPVTSVVFCGNLPNNTTNYLAPMGGGPGKTGAGEGIDSSPVGTPCQAGENTTEATADEILFNGWDSFVVGMYCRAVVASSGATGSGSNGVTFTLRSAAAAIAPSPACTVATGQVDCSWSASGSGGLSASQNLPKIAAAATADVRAVSTEDLSANTGWCRVFLALPL